MASIARHGENSSDGTLIASVDFSNTAALEWQLPFEQAIAVARRDARAQLDDTLELVERREERVWRLYARPKIITAARPIRDEAWQHPDKKLAPHEVDPKKVPDPVKFIPRHSHPQPLSHVIYPSGHPHSIAAE